MGCLPLYPPLELFHSLDLVPVVLWGFDGLKDGVSESDKHIQNYVCSVARRLTEFVLIDGRNLLDGLFMYNACDTLRNLPEILECGLGDQGISIPLLNIHIPAMSKKQTDGSKYLEGEITSLISKLEQEYGVTYSEKKFMESADLYREMRSLSLELEKLTASGIIGFRDFVRIIHKQYFMPVDVQVASLRSCIKKYGSLSAGKNFSEGKKNVVLSGILPPPSSICDILEKSDFTVTGNDIASLYRSYCYHPQITGDAREYYINFYQNHFPCTTLLSTSDSRVKAIINLIRERKAHGFIFIGEKFCEYEYLEIPFVDKILKDEGIHTLHLEFSIDDNENTEAFRTRIESFAEAMNG